MNIELLAERFVDSVPRVSIREQLKWFKIDLIRFVDYLKSGTARIWVDEYHGEYRKQRGVDREVTIALPRKTTLEDKLMSVGHELGHTFQVFPADSSLRGDLHFGTPRNGGKWGRSLGLNSIKEVETFCDSFGALWLQQRTNKRELAKLLMSSLGVGTVRI